VDLAETAGAGPVVLLRPDGHVAARGRPGRMPAVTGYLRELFGEPDPVPAATPPGALSPPAVVASGQWSQGASQ
jgi:hypothetical protein